MMNDTYSQPLITTIIPTYQRPKMLRRAICSVINQTYPRFQVCVYDNASGDETRQVVAELAKKDQRIKYYCHSKNIGAFENFVYAMEQIKTPFFSLLSDDDVLLPEFYETAMKGFSEFPDAAFSAGSTIAMDEEGKALYCLVSLWPREGYYTHPEGLFEMIEGKPPTWIAIVFRKEVIMNIGNLDLKVGLPIDLDFILRIAAHSSFVISKKPCAIFVRHRLSHFCTPADSHFLWPSWKKIIFKLKADEKLPSEIKDRAELMLKKWLKRMLYAYAVSAIRKKDFKDAYRITKILYTDCQAKVKAIIFYVAAKLREHCSPVYYLLDYLNRVRRFSRFQKTEIASKQLQEEFGSYARFLTIGGHNCTQSLKVGVEPEKIGIVK